MNWFLFKSVQFEFEANHEESGDVLCIKRSCWFSMHENIHGRTVAGEPERLVTKSRCRTIFVYRKQGETHVKLMTFSQISLLKAEVRIFHARLRQNSALCMSVLTQFKTVKERKWKKKKKIKKLFACFFLRF